MSEDAKLFGGGTLVAKPFADDRKAAAAARKFIIKSADMGEDVQKEAVDMAIAAFEKHNVEKDVAEYIKKEFDKKHGPTWHCIIGKNFVVLCFSCLPFSNTRWLLCRQSYMCEVPYDMRTRFIKRMDVLRHLTVAYKFMELGIQ
ncbi:uncharacterized protein LOC130775185 isoform X1 [Actinidia eriantha]|uniref:uncharacterized protein LOC130775185 isoform X1 n=1 Tax=Actinidia eriantha TaxID=165200 RepID=UPI00258949B3|nr:uncharacterized protein LOC130775185 isoform X1 [Actinidia eriantha]